LVEEPALVCVDPARVAEVWPLVSALMDRAQERFGSNDERMAIEKDVREGLALLWMAWSDDRKIEAALVTDIIKEDDYKVCRLRALAGYNIQRWFKLLGRIEGFARDEKCRVIRYFGRKGWTIMLGADYRVTHVMAEKVL
jgi:hypothetical protein